MENPCITILQKSYSFLLYFFFAVMNFVFDLVKTVMELKPPAVIYARLQISFFWDSHGCESLVFFFPRNIPF